MNWFRPSPPADDLRTAVTCTWDVVADGHHDLFPDGSIELLWIRGGGVWVCGPDTTGWSFDLPPGTVATGVRFHPGAGGRVLGFGAAELLDQRVRLSAVLSDGIERSLDDDLAAAGDGPARQRVLERIVRRRVEVVDAEPMVLAAAVLGRWRRPIGKLDQLADEFGVSSRQFRRRFTDSVGYSPAYYTRVARLQRFLRVAATGHRSHTGHTSLADLAVAAGYTDQAHLHRDSTAITGMTPRQVLSVVPRSSALLHTLDGRSVQDGDDEHRQD